MIIVTDHERVYYQTAIVWGGKSFLVKDMKSGTDEAIRQLKASGILAKGDAVVLASGHQPGLVGGTDNVQIKIVD